MKVHVENWLGVGKWETQQATYRLECYSDKTAINSFSSFYQKNWFCSRGLGVQVQIQILSSISSMISSWLLYFSEPESRDIGHRQKRGKKFYPLQSAFISQILPSPIFESERGTQNPRRLDPVPLSSLLQLPQKNHWLHTSKYSVCSLRVLLAAEISSQEILGDAKQRWYLTSSHGLLPGFWHYRKYRTKTIFPQAWNFSDKLMP